MTALLIATSLLIGWAALLAGCFTAATLFVHVAFPVMEWVSDRSLPVAVLLLVPAAALLPLTAAVGTAVGVGGGWLAVAVWP